MKAKSEITEEMFEKAVGRPYRGYELTMCNCPKAGDEGHEFCGWNYEVNLPCFKMMDEWNSEKLRLRIEAEEKKRRGKVNEQCIS